MGDIRAMIESDREAHDATWADLDRAIKQNRQATETETNERTYLFKENNQTLTELREILSKIKGIEDISAVRKLLQNSDQKVMLQLRQLKNGIEKETSERVTNVERLEKRVAELRGSVIASVRVPGRSK